MFVAPRFALFLLALVAFGPGAARAQSPSAPAPDSAAPAPAAVPRLPPRAAFSTGPVRGVVWQAPAAAATADLAAVRRSGFTAVRVDGPPGEAVLRAADSLGLYVYVDLPVDYALRGDLDARMPALRRTIDSLGAQARRHPSVRAVGLARRPDTSDPQTCDRLGDLARHARARGLSSYYVAAFIESDRCDGVVDVVLVGARDRAQPETRLERWARTHTTPAGLATVGYWVDPDVRGTRAAHSPEAQARTFEALFTRLDTVDAPVFVYRWRDVPGTQATSDDPLGRPYGLHDTDGVGRPSLAVVRGLLTDTLSAFAFEAGTARRGGTPSLVGLFWLAVLLAALVYAIEPRIRTLVPRYFRAHGFYRDALRDARDTLAPATFTLMVATVLATGVAVAALAEVLRLLPSFEAFVTLLPPVLGRTVGELVARPWLLAVFVALVDALSMALWTLLFYLAARRRYLFSAWQALGFVVWPRWAAFPLAAAALVAATLPPGLAPRVALAVAGLLALSIVWGGVRALLDLRIVSRPTLTRLALGVLLHPVVLVGVYLTLRAAFLGPRVAFLWRLATQA